MHNYIRLLIKIVWLGCRYTCSCRYLLSKVAAIVCDRENGPLFFVWILHITIFVIKNMYLWCTPPFTFYKTQFSSAIWIITCVDFIPHKDVLKQKARCKNISRTYVGMYILDNFEGRVRVNGWLHNFGSYIITTSKI